MPHQIRIGKPDTVRLCSGYIDGEWSELYGCHPGYEACTEADIR